MTPIIHERAMLRIPQFSIAATLIDQWDNLKISIRHSSPEFYRYIAQVTADEIGNLAPAIAFTVWKYFNRAKYRPVPYGHFAGIAAIDLSRKEEEFIRIADQFLHQFVNWADKDGLNIQESTIDFEQLDLFANSSHYATKDAIRYVSFFEAQYQLSEIGRNSLISTILAMCSRPVRYPLVIAALESYGCKPKEARRIVQSLISLQLLISSQQPNIIGEDYFKRLGLRHRTDTDYIIAERPIRSGSLSDSRFRYLPELVSLLATSVKPSSTPDMTEFRKRFLSKYADHEVPLMTALDQEYGVGYGDLEYAGDIGSLASKFLDRGMSSAETFNFKDTLLQHMMSSPDGRTQPIDLAQVLSGAPAHAAVLPNSISALLSLGDELIYAESIGGSTSNAILGRFTIGPDRIADQAREIAKLEADANPGVLFFDIGYTAEKTIDNINRRRSIYPLQLNLLNYDTSDDPLSLADLLISVKEDMVVLKSRKLNKRLIPRLASAYNYNRSDLSVFRFLCDLQSQGLQTNLTIDLQELFPGLNHYPRVQFKNIVLSPAKWKISNIGQLSGLKLSRYFLTGVADQTLCFDQCSEEDMCMFDQYLSKQKALYVREAFVDRASMIRDEQGAPYHAQALLSIVHTDQIYPGLDDRPCIDFSEKLQQTIPPGLDWIYFEIYGHYTVANELLTGPVAELLNSQSAFIKDWFFIRYTENGHHLRLRLHLKDRMFSQQIIESLAGLLSADLAQGKVANVLLNSYQRETQRYIGNDIRDIERHFCCDSTYVMAILSLELTDFQKYGLCEILVNAVNIGRLFAADQFSGLLYEIAAGYNKEHSITNLDFKEINVGYKKFLQDYEQVILTVLQDTAHRRFINSFLDTLSKCGENFRERLFSDLLHMHFNRLFPSGQRTHEMIFYNFLIKKHKKQRFFLGS